MEKWVKSKLLLKDHNLIYLLLIGMLPDKNFCVNPQMRTWIEMKLACIWCYYYTIRVHPTLKLFRPSLYTFACSQSAFPFHYPTALRRTIFAQRNSYRALLNYCAQQQHLREFFLGQLSPAPISFFPDLRIICGTKKRTYAKNREHFLNFRADAFFYLTKFD